VIWTTTAWTIPANQALNLNPALDYALVDTERGLLVLAASAGRKVPGALRPAAGSVLATTVGEKLGGMNFRHPLAHVDAGYDRLSARSTWPTTPPPTTAPASCTRRPAYGVDDFNSCVRTA
jgi:isoleucyl-tRNA synthetase